MEGFFGQPVESKVPDFMSQIGQFLGDNKMAILGTLAGAAGGQDRWDGVSKAIMGLANGGQLDTQYADQRTQKMALQNALKSQNLTPQQMALAQAAPKDYLGNLIENQFKKPEFKTFGDSKTGFFVADPSAPNGVRRVVDPAAPELPSSIQELKYLQQNPQLADFKQQQNVPNEIRELQFLQNNPQLAELQRKQKQSGATNITQNAGSNALDKGISEEMIKERSAAAAAADGVRSLRTAKNFASSPEFISGFAAEQRLALAKVGSALGFNQDQVKNTESFRAAIGSSVLPVLEKLKPASDTDVQFAREVAGGTIKLDAPSIKRIIEINEKLAVESIGRHNSKVKQYFGETQDPNIARNRDFLMVQPPEDVPATQGAPSVDLNQLGKKHGVQIRVKQ